MTDRERLKSAILAKAAERFSLRLLDRAIRIAWYEGVVQCMDGSRHKTLGSFLRSRAGKRFRRRSNWVLRSG
jgi:hypothetical protein